MAKAGRGDAQYMVRFPEGLRDAVKSAAEANSRSMNDEIIDRLAQSLSGEGVSNETRATIRKLREEVSRLEGLNEGLGRTVKLFFEHLTLTEEGQKFVLKAILEDEFRRTQNKGDN